MITVQHHPPKVWVFFCFWPLTFRDLPNQFNRTIERTSSVIKVQTIPLCSCQRQRKQAVKSNSNISRNYRSANQKPPNWITVPPSRNAFVPKKTTNISSSSVMNNLSNNECTADVYLSSETFTRRGLHQSLTFRNRQEVKQRRIGVRGPTKAKVSVSLCSTLRQSNWK